MPDARTSNGWIAWREEGPREPADAGDPVLLIMGLGASSRLWFRLLPWLTREHRVIVFDNRGTGSSAPVRGRLTMGGLAEDAVTVLDAAGIERAHVVGASMGGMIAQHMALDHRDRVRSVVLACTTRRRPQRGAALAAARLGGRAPTARVATQLPARGAGAVRRRRPCVTTLTGSPTT